MKFLLENLLPLPIKLIDPIDIEQSRTNSNMLLFGQTAVWLTNFVSEFACTIGLEVVASIESTLLEFG